jgi:hypothetical protein
MSRYAKCEKRVEKAPKLLETDRYWARVKRGVVNMKSIVKALSVAGIAACFATAAMAGGFSFGSAGGNAGKWAYGDGAAFGGAEVNSYYGGQTWSESGAGSETTKSSCYYCGGYSSSTSAEAGSFNESGFSTSYGSGHAQSHSSAVAGSGVGFGLGFKTGDFNTGN